MSGLAGLSSLSEHAAIPSDITVMNSKTATSFALFITLFMLLIVPASFITVKIQLANLQNFFIILRTHSHLFIYINRHDGRLSSHVRLSEAEGNPEILVFHL